jgi:hypothetical protein
MTTIDRARLSALLGEERARHRERTPSSRAAFSYCDHGSVDETFVITGPNGAMETRGGNVGPATTAADVDLHTVLFRTAVERLVA